MIPPPLYNTASNGYNSFMDDDKSPAAAVGSIQPQLHAKNLALAGGQSAFTKQVRARKAIRGLGITQIVLGVLLASFNITLIAGSASNPYYHDVLGVDGSGIWGGVLTSIAGIFAVLVSGRASKSRLTACMVLSIFAAVAAGSGLILNADSLSWAAYKERVAYFTRADDYGTNDAPVLVGAAGGVILSIINLAVSIACAALMCQNSSCCCRCCCCGDDQTKTVVIAIPMENIQEVLAMNQSGGNTNITVVPYKP